MATLARPSPSPPRSLKNKSKSCARRCERGCWTFLTYFPLFMVYGLTTWAAWVQAKLGLAPETYGWTGTSSAVLGIAIYILLNWSYSVAVFTDPGSPLTQTTSAYSIVPSDGDDDPEMNINGPPMTEGPAHASVTVKSTGETRYCKKCHTRKPDRAHHCSTCRRCVLKMDHHCPWLATCVGFRNQKAFVLFLIYVSLFCWLCFGVSATWTAAELFGSLQDNDAIFPVNCIMLAVLSGIIGLVITGFTGWHIYLACTGQTTIESLEKVRYKTPHQKTMQHSSVPNGPDADNRHYYDKSGSSESAASTIGQQIGAANAIVVPGITSPEEGVVTEQRASTPSRTQPSPAHNSLRQHLGPGDNAAYDRNRERDHERARYQAYLDEVDSAKMPHAFNHGWKRNLRQLFGDRPALAWLPIGNSGGDGWNWEPSQDWLEARDNLERERAARRREDEAFERDRAETMQSRGLHRGRAGSISSSETEDEDLPLARRKAKMPPPPGPRGSSSTPISGASQKSGLSKGPTSNWNDIPEDFLSARSRSPAKRGGRKNG